MSKTGEKLKDCRLNGGEDGIFLDGHVSNSCTLGDGHFTPIIVDDDERSVPTIL